MRLVIHATLSMVVLVACGGDSKPDAAMEVMGLGQKCNPAMMGADCPAGVGGCLTFMPGATVGLCSAFCVMPGQGSFMTNAATPPVPGPLMPDPATQNGVCAPLYMSSIGSGVCNALVNIVPSPAGGFMPNTRYTFGVACVVACGANGACPFGLTCDNAPPTPWCRP